MTILQSAIIAVVQAAILLLLAPVFTGISRVMRAKMHSRHGPGILQDYRDLFKLFKRQDVAPAASGVLFHIMPYELLGTMLLVAMVLPIFSLQAPVGVAGDLITFAYLFALTRFLFSVSGLESGSPFAALGASRESTLGILVEPTMILSLLVAALISGTTNLSSISRAIVSGQVPAPAAMFLAFVAFGFAVYIEMGKLPFDMAEAEQELQEGPLTEYAGSGLATLKWGLALKKLVVASFFVTTFIPYGTSETLSFGSSVQAFVLFLIKLLVVYLLASLIENGMARGRFLLTSRTTWVGFGVASLSFVFYLAGL